eukprot:TRINITY_DN10721_c0_g2_i1.p1 TRINITY_DN10721_c0_g2~~TRINITY_DN10721_c0_g2_i1.p1  ORF type:complete len:696 (+),score=70.16 TRINITY_DN10721_c0_g2_i1:91-2088(+)
MEEQSDLSELKRVSKPTDIESVLNNLRARPLDEVHVLIESLLEEYPELARRFKKLAEPELCTSELPPVDSIVKRHGSNESMMTSVLSALGVKYAVDGRSCSETEYQKYRRCNTFPSVNYAEYDVTTEAKDGVRFNTRVACFELLSHLLFPFSIPFVYLHQGRLGLEMHGWILGGKPHDTVKADAASVGIPPFAVMVIQYVQAAIPQLTLIMGLALMVVGHLPWNSPVVPELMIIFVTSLFGAAVRSLKYGFRPPSSGLRMIDHISRRHEEFFFGWIQMPDDYTIFLIRLAAARCDLDLNGTCVMVHPNANVASMFSSAPVLERVSEAGVVVCVADMSQVTEVKIHVPIFLILFEMFSKIRVASKGGHGLSSKRQLYGNFGYLTHRAGPFICLVVGAMPTIVRWQFLDDFDSWSPNWVEIMVMVVGAFTLLQGCLWTNMVLSASFLVFVRRHILSDLLAGLVDGNFPGLGKWRLASTTTEAYLVDSVRRVIACYDENFGRRAVGALGMLFVFVAVSKLFVLALFLLSNFTGEKLAVREEPVVPALLGLLPFVFALPIIAALLAGARLNEFAKLRLLAAIDHRRRSLIEYREDLVRDEASEIKERRLECVQQAFEALADHIGTQQRPMVLLGWSGRGMLELTIAKVLSYISECVLHAGMLFQVCNFG